MQGASVLVIASFIARVLSAPHRIPLQNLVDDESSYVYQRVYPVYGIAMTLALSDPPQFISKYVAERKNSFEREQALQSLYPLVFWTGVSLWLLVFSFSSRITWMVGDIQLKPLVQVVSLTFLLVSDLSLYRGNFQGRFLMEPMVASQVAKQLVRVPVIVCGAFAFRESGWTAYQTGTTAMSGAVFGGLCIYGILHYHGQKIHGGVLSFRRFPLFRQLPKSLIRCSLVEGGLIPTYSGSLTFSQLIDSFFVRSALEVYGLSGYGTRIAKGVYGRGQPLVQLGLMTATALSATFLPALTRHLTSRIYRQFLQTAKAYLRLITVLALAASLGLALLLPYTNYALLKDYAGNAAFVLFVFSVTFTVVIQAYQSIAQSKNPFRPSLKGTGQGLLVKGLATSFLTGLLGAAGIDLSTLLGLDVTLWYFARIETKELNAFWKERRFGWRLIISSLCITAVLFPYYGVLNIVFGPVTHRSTAFFASMIGAGIDASMLVYAMIRLCLLTVREWLMLPSGKKIL